MAEKMVKSHKEDFEMNELGSSRNGILSVCMFENNDGAVFGQVSSLNPCWSPYLPLDQFDFLFSCVNFTRQLFQA